MEAWPRFVLRWSLLAGAGFGVAAAAVVAALRAAEGESLAPALVVGAVAAALAVPAAAAVIVEQAWPGLADLRSRDRRAVVRAVRHGKPFDPRLGPAVLGYAAHTRRTLARTGARPDPRRQVLLWVACALAVTGFTVAAVLGDSSPTGVVVLGASALWVVGVAVYLPHVQRRVLRNADRAAATAGTVGPAGFADPDARR